MRPIFDGIRVGRIISILIPERTAIVWCYGDRRDHMELELYENLARPVFMVENKHHYCLLDTGALFPVWCSSVKALRVRYPESYETDDVLYLKIIR